MPVEIVDRVAGIAGRTRAEALTGERRKEKPRQKNERGQRSRKKETL